MGSLPTRSSLPSLEQLTLPGVPGTSASTGGLLQKYKEQHLILLAQDYHDSPSQFPPKCVEVGQTSTPRSRTGWNSHQIHQPSPPKKIGKRMDCAQHPVNNRRSARVVIVTIPRYLCSLSLDYRPVPLCHQTRFQEKRF